MPRHAAVFLAFTFITVSSAGAHHNLWAFFDLCKRVTIEARVDNVRWQNTHIYFDLTTDDGTVYLTEWTQMNDPRTAASTKLLKTGDRVVITGSLAKDAAKLLAAYPALKGIPDPKMVSALMQIRRVSDGWTWSRGAKPSA